MKRLSQQGVTLLELIAAMVLIALVMVPMQALVGSITSNAARVEATTIATLLAQEELELIMVRKAVPRGFDQIQDVVVTPFEPPFANYTYQVTVLYQNYTGLSFEDAGPGADYKRVTVRVVRAGSAEILANLSTVIGRYGELPSL